MKKQGKVAKTCYHHAALVLIIHYGWTNLMLTPYNIFPTFQMPHRPFGNMVWTVDRSCSIKGSLLKRTTIEQFKIQPSCESILNTHSHNFHNTYHPIFKNLPLHLIELR